MIINRNSKSEAKNLMQNINLTKKSGTLSNVKNFYHI